jgi:hypothetical protein
MQTEVIMKNQEKQNSIDISENTTVQNPETKPCCKPDSDSNSSEQKKKIAKNKAKLVSTEDTEDSDKTPLSVGV